MRKKDFIDSRRRYIHEIKRFRGIKPGDLVWIDCHYPIKAKYYPAVVEKVNVDDNYVNAVDVLDDEQEIKICRSFLTEQELMEKLGFSKKFIEKEYKKYESVIKSVIGNKTNRNLADKVNP